MFAKTKRTFVVWFPCLAATFSSVKSATCKYLCTGASESLRLTSALLTAASLLTTTSGKRNNDYLIKKGICAIFPLINHVSMFVIHYHYHCHCYCYCYCHYHYNTNLHAICIYFYRIIHHIFASLTTFRCTIV